MKNIFLTVVLLVLGNMVMAQAPQGIPYQAVARNSSGAVLASTAISVRFTIRDSIATGAIKYRETFSVTTSAQGIFSVNVGQGAPVTGTFAGINWGANAKFMQIEIDPTGGSSYIDMGTQQMMSVPYALFAERTSASVVIGNLFLTTTTPNTFSGTINCISGGNIICDGGMEVITKGVCWSTTHNPTIALSSKTIDGNGVGQYSSTVTLLVPNTTYYFRAYLTNISGTYYGNEVSITTPPFLIGMNYGGGIVFYIDSTGSHGLISMSTNLASYQWGPTPVFLGATGTAVGTGISNTNIVVASYGFSYTAAGLCKAHSGSGYSDWYLPSKDELEIMYTQRSILLMSGNYWSSSESNANNAWIKNFSTGSGGYGLKGNSIYIRAIRSF
jgi:hypothetical protein